MMSAEADALCGLIDQHLSGLSGVVVNIGSKRTTFRVQEQPWTGRVVHELERRGLQVVHVDLAPGPGVDEVGDIVLAPFRRRLEQEYKPALVLCTNVLEHVPDRPAFIGALQRLAAPAGSLLCSIPRRYPYHPDPIDNGWRPTADDLARSFSRMEAIATLEVGCGTVWRRFGELRRLKGPPSPATPGHAGRPRWRAAARHLPHLVVPYRVSVCLLRSR